METSRAEVEDSFRMAIAIARAIDIDDLDSANSLFGGCNQDAVVLAAMQIIAALVQRCARAEDMTYDELWLLMIDAVDSDNQDNDED